MIKIAGSVHRAFIFPADLPTAWDYYSNMQRILHMLPHISILEYYGDEQYRMLYSTTELGIYRIRIICDMRVELDRSQSALRVLHLEGKPEIKTKAGMYSISGQGYYTSESVFKSRGEQTEIDYRLRLRSQLSVPLGLRFMPHQLVNEIARNLAQWRINEIAEGFIERSLLAFEKLQQTKD